jgi:hypothetical protein
MQKGLLLRVGVFTVLLAISGYLFAQTGGKTAMTEKFEMTVVTTNNMISYDKIKYQRAATMEEREGRGIISSFLISKGIQGIQSLINNRRKRYTADYSFAIKDESFYDQVSTDGPFDPTGIRFKGFKVTRILRGGNHSDTAFVAKFSIDTAGEKISEILNNGIFRLRLDSFILKRARVKVPSHQKKLNMDFEISFLSSFITNSGQINTDVTVGKFIYSIRNAPIDPNDPGYDEYYKNLPEKHPYCIGQSFLIPRSAGYFKNDETKKLEQCWGEGLFSIKVAVKECSKNSFVDKVIIYSSDDVLSVGGASLQKRFGAPPAASGKARTTTTAAPRKSAN